jgi:hypothetical protein
LAQTHADNEQRATVQIEEEEEEKSKILGADAAVGPGAMLIKSPSQNQK